MYMQCVVYEHGRSRGLNLLGLCLLALGLGTVLLASPLARHVVFWGKVEKRLELSLVSVVTSWTAQ